jgi:colanic acid/amylovoran biosynthesis glycosyltransferase
MAEFPMTKYRTHSLNWNESILDKLFWLFFIKPSKRKSRQLLKLLQIENPDVLHFHYGSDAGIFLPVLKKLKIPSLVSFYGYDCTGFPKYYFGLGKLFLKERVFSRASIITAMSKDMKKDLIKLGCKADKVTVHYHGIETRIFHLGKKDNSGNLIRFLIISKFTAQKGHIFLLNAFQKAFNKTRNIQLTIVGSGVEKNRIEQHISDRQIENISVQSSVKYGSIEHLNYLLNADVFVHPSITDLKGNKEGIPGTIVEAMSIGLPVISTYHAGIPEIIKHMQTGILIEENDIAALAGAIVTLAEQPTLRKNLGQNAKEYALSELDIIIKEKELEDLYFHIIH